MTGCSSDSLADQYKTNDNRGYVSGDGTYSEVPAGERRQPIEFSGRTQDGDELMSEALRGKIVVVNFWYAGCPPCRVETPDLVALNAKYQDRGVAFVGANVYDQPDTAATFQREFGVTYPSIIDVDDASMRTAFAGELSPRAIPSTFVLDREGRIAWRYVGRADKSVLDSMIEQTLGES